MPSVPFPTGDKRQMLVGVGVLFVQCERGIIKICLDGLRRTQHCHDEQIQLRN